MTVLLAIHKLSANALLEAREACKVLGLTTANWIGGIPQIAPFAAITGLDFGARRIPEDVLALIEATPGLQVVLCAQEPLVKPRIVLGEGVSIVGPPIDRTHIIEALRAATVPAAPDGFRILVIDDSTTLRKLVEIAMRGTGYKVEFAANGSDGVSSARANRPDVILLDYLLPDLRSAEVCQRLHDDPTTARVPVVIMSANDRSVLDELRRYPMVVGFIGKPFSPAEIRTRLEGVVRRHGEPTRGTAAAVNGHAVIAPGATADHDVIWASPALQLRGDLATTPLLEVLRLLAASHATGALLIEHAGTARLWLRRGEILMCSGPEAAASVPAELTPDLRERLARGLVIGKPLSVTLAEAGVTRATNLPLDLHAASARMISELLASRSGRFGWEPAASLPDFVEAFGRQLSLTAVTLGHSRRAAGPSSPGVLEYVYDRTPRFSEKLAGARLNADEQRVLAVLDGQTTGRDILARAKLPPDRGATILTRLCAADLIHHDSTEVESLPSG